MGLRCALTPVPALFPHSGMLRRYLATGSRSPENTQSSNGEGALLQQRAVHTNCSGARDFLGARQKCGGPGKRRASVNPSAAAAGSSLVSEAPVSSGDCHHASRSTSVPCSPALTPLALALCAALAASSCFRNAPRSTCFCSRPYTCGQFAADTSAQACQSGQILTAQQALLQEALQPEYHSCHSLHAIICTLLQQKLADASKHMPHNHLGTASIIAKRSKLGITHLVGALVGFQAGLEPRCRSLRLPNLLQTRPVSMPRTFYA